MVLLQTVWVMSLYSAEHLEWREGVDRVPASSCSGEVELNCRVTAIMVGADAQAEFQPNQKLFTGKALRPNTAAWNSALSRP